MERECFAGAFKGIKHTVHQALYHSFVLQINVKMICLCNKGNAKLGIVIVCYAMFQYFTSHTTSAFANLFFAYRYYFVVAMLLDVFSNAGAYD